jgi:hypothetical protein
MRIIAAATPEQLAIIEGLDRRIVPDFYAPFFDRAGRWGCTAKTGMPWPKRY